MKGVVFAVFSQNRSVVFSIPKPAWTLLGVA